MIKLPTDRHERKGIPVATGVVDYFPLALCAIAKLSKVGNDQHNPGQPLHWSRGKSDDHADTLMRHFIERGTSDTDGVPHSAKVAWRALAILQLELEAAEAGDALDAEDDQIAQDHRVRVIGLDRRRRWACDRRSYTVPELDQGRREAPRRRAVG